MLASLVEQAEDTHMKTSVFLKSAAAGLLAVGFASAQAGNIALGKERLIRLVPLATGRMV